MANKWKKRTNWHQYVEFKFLQHQENCMPPAGHLLPLTVKIQDYSYYD